MKYAKELQIALTRLPKHLQEASLNYKQWKKQSKEMTIDEALVVLRAECEEIEHIFCDQYHHCCHPPSLFARCFCLRAPISSQTLLLFAEMNAKTLYKICKRLGKQGRKNPIPMEWFTSVRASHMYGFLGGHHTVHLALQQCYHRHDSLLECPICLQELSPKFILIYACGHYACVLCTLQYAKVNSLHGAWYHLLINAQRRSCPFCRYEKAFQTITTI